MKKILLSTAVLTVFSLSVILFQISCKKSADAATPSTSTSVQQENKILYSTDEGTVVNGFNIEKLHTANYDGTNVTDINLVLPAGVSLVHAHNAAYYGNPCISPDHKTIFFEVVIKGTSNAVSFAIYSCNIDGSNPHQISTTNKNPAIAVAF